MATISKHYGKWQAQIRIKNYTITATALLFI